MKLFLKTKDFSVSNEEFDLLLDTNLELLVTQPKPDNLEPYYESDAYISHTDGKNTLLERCYQVVKKHSLRKKVALINRFLPHKRTLLDFGAGTGDFLLAANEQGWNTTGIEPNSKAKARAVNKGVTMQDNIASLAGERFEVVTLWHVLEHLPDLDAQIAKITSLLSTNGTLVIAVPNFNSFDAKHYKEHWAAYDVPRHLWHFSKTAIAKIFAKHQWKVVSVKPMWFDAFYVALLSEKYKHGKQRPLSAFLVGLWSNLCALYTKECSSHIYVLKKQNDTP